MRFVARSPREGINVSAEHPLAEALTLTLGLAAALFALTGIFVFFVDIVIATISPETEARIFARWPASVAADFEAPEAAGLQSVVDRLNAHLDHGSERYRVGLLDTATANATAIPGGTIAVTRGLLEQVETENELAFVLAHEIAHFENRDHLRLLGRSVSLGVLVAAVSGHDGGLVSGNVASIAALRFNQRQESAADLAALELVFLEYGHVNGAWQLFERLAGRGPRGASAGYLATHPAPANRVARLRDAAAANGWPLDGPTRPFSSGSARRDAD